MSNPSVNRATSEAAVSTFVYLNEEVRKSEGFKASSSPIRVGTGMSIYGHRLFEGNGRPHLMWDVDLPIPKEIENLVEEVSCYESFPQMSNREPGIYRHESATCELTPDQDRESRNSRPIWKVRITAEKLEHIREILHMIKVGTIRPTESYAAPQGGKSRQELEELAALLSMQLDRERTVAQDLSVKNITLQERLRSALDDAGEFSAKLHTIKKIVMDAEKLSVLRRPSVKALFNLIRPHLLG